MWSPLGFSIMFGLLFSSILTLVVIPVLYFRYGEKSLSNIQGELQSRCGSGTSDDCQKSDSDDSLKDDLPRSGPHSGDPKDGPEGKNGPSAARRFFIKV